MMPFDKFIPLYTNRYIDFEGAYPNSCMDLMHFYCYICLDIFDKTVLSAPIAKNVWIYWKSAWDQYFTRVPNGPVNYPSNGDIVFWSTGTTGHVAICTSANPFYFYSFDANWPSPSMPHIQYHSYNGVLGWLKPKILVP